MIANLVSTLIGVALVYAAVLDPPLIGGDTITLFIAGFAVIGLALWARTSDSAGWFSSTNMAAGLGMVMIAALQAMKLAAPLMTFWGVFWAGLIVAVVALWSALYRPRQQPLTPALSP
jgi:hypothetical protein